MPNKMGCIWGVEKTRTYGNVETKSRKPRINSGGRIYGCNISGLNRNTKNPDNINIFVVVPEYDSLFGNTVKLLGGNMVHELMVPYEYFEDSSPEGTMFALPLDWHGHPKTENHWWKHKVAQYHM